MSNFQKIKIQEFESPLPHFKKPVLQAGFIIKKNNFAKTLPKLYNYRKPKLIKSKSGWYIEYYYRIPDEIQHLHDNKQWMRFRLREDLNRRKGPEREAYAEILLTGIESELRHGFNPFTQVIEQFDKIVLPSTLPARDALKLFLDKWKQRGLDKASLSKYERYINRLIDWLAVRNIQYNDIKEITNDHIETFLSETKLFYKYSNREYNNTLDFIRTAFNFLVTKKFITENPCTGISKLKSKSSKHQFYDEISLKAITKALLELDPQCYFVCQVVYYLCVRSGKELVNLKVGNIKWEQDVILADVTKGSTERYIPMDKNIKELFLSKGIDKYPPEYYIIGIKEPQAKPVGKTLFTERFQKVRTKAGLSDKFTLYAWKHTRVINLKTDGASDADIMSLTGHKDFTSYTHYLRDLGMTANQKSLNDKGRKL